MPHTCRPCTVCTARLGKNPLVLLMGGFPAAPHPLSPEAAAVSWASQGSARTPVAGGQSHLWRHHVFPLLAGPPAGDPFL